MKVTIAPAKSAAATNLSNCGGIEKTASVMRVTIKVGN
jgi:hypothetical protein